MLDGIIIVILLGAILIGAKKGFVQSAFSLIASAVSLIIAFMVYPVVNGIIKLTPIYEYIRLWNINKLSEVPLITGLQEQADMIKKTTEWLPSFIGENLIKNNNKEVYELMGVTNVAEYIGTYITQICVSALAIVITWVLVRMVLGVVMHTLDLFTKLPVIHTANKYSGAALGGVKGILLVWIFLLIIPLLAILPSFSDLSGMVDSSIIGKFLYENNLLLKGITWAFLGK